MNIIDFDFETEGLNLGLTRPWQLAYVETSQGKIIEEQDLYIDIHDLNINPQAAAVTGFSWDVYNKRKRPADEVVKIIEEKMIYSDNILVAHNGLGFDVYVMANLFTYVGKKLVFKDFIYRVIDTLCIARGKFHGIEVPDDPRERLEMMYKMLSRIDRSFKGKLSDIAKDYGIDFDPTKLHDAIYDVRLLDKVYQRISYGTNLPK